MANGTQTPPQNPPQPSYDQVLNAQLAKHFDAPVILTFDNDVREHIIDYILLKQLIERNRTSFFDYSFILTPLCKALEGQYFWMLLQVGFFSSSDDPKNLGAKLAEKKRQNAFRKYLKDQKTLTDREINQVINKIQRSADFYQTYRNLPLHYDGKKKSTLEKATNAASAILDEINEFTNAIAASRSNISINISFGFEPTSF